MNSPNIREGSREETMDFFRRVFDGEAFQFPPVDPEKLRTCNTSFVAVDKGDVVGAVSLELKPPGQSGSTLSAAYVSCEYSGRGVGPDLCEAAIRHCIRTERLPVYVEVTSRWMHSALKKLPSALQDEKYLRLDLTYKEDDLWENWLDAKRLLDGGVCPKKRASSSEF